MSRLIEITCPDPTCGRKWWMDYDDLQAYKVIYQSVDKPDASGAGRLEEYRLRCPNPAHGEYMIVTLRIVDSDE